MASIHEALSKNGTAPYNRPLKVKVVAAQLPVTYRNREGEQKQCISCAISDGVSVILCAVYDSTKFNKFKVGQTVVLRDIIKKTENGSASFVVTKTSKVFLSATIEVPDALVMEGDRLLNPPPSPLTTLEKALRSPQKTRVSVSGKVVSEEAIRTVSVRGEDVPIKTLHVSDDTVQSCKVTLWREMSSVDVRPGDYITITDVVINTYKNETSLSGTSRTSVKKCEAPLEDKMVNVIGVSVEDGLAELLIDNDEIISMPAELLLGAMPEQSLQPVDIEQLTSEGPVTLKITCKGAEVISVYVCEKNSKGADVNSENVYENN